MNFGLTPAALSHLAVLPLPIILWQLSLSRARKRDIVGFHNASLAVSYWEEILFRGLALGLALHFTKNDLYAIGISSAVFGLFHLRNLWWAGWRRALLQVFYNGLLIGPLLGFIRIWSGDIYTGIAVHYLHNYAAMYLNRQLLNKIPTDELLDKKRARMSKLVRLFTH